MRLAAISASAGRATTYGRDMRLITNTPLLSLTW